MFKLKTIQFHSASTLSKMLKTLNKRLIIIWYDVKYDTSKGRNVGKKFVATDEDYLSKLKR